MQITWVIVAKDSVIDRDTGELSLFGIIPGLVPIGLPLFIPQVAVAAYIRRAKGEPETVQATLTIYLQGNELFKMPVNVDFQGRMGSYIVSTLRGLLVSEPGTLIFEYSATGIATQTCEVDVDAPFPTAKPIESVPATKPTVSATLSPTQSSATSAD